MLPLKNLDLIPSKSNKILTRASLKFIFDESRLQKCNFYAFWGNRWSFYIFIWLEISCNNLEFNSNVLIQFGLNFQALRFSLSSVNLNISQFIFNQTNVELRIFVLDYDQDSAGRSRPLMPQISKNLRPHSRPGPHPGRPRPKFLIEGYFLNLETRFR